MRNDKAHATDEFEGGVEQSTALCDRIMLAADRAADRMLRQPIEAAAFLDTSREFGVPENMHTVLGLDADELAEAFGGGDTTPVEVLARITRRIEQALA